MFTRSSFLIFSAASSTFGSGPFFVRIPRFSSSSILARCFRASSRRLDGSSSLQGLTFNVPVDVFPLEALVRGAIVVNQVHMIGPEPEQHDANDSTEDTE